MLLTEFGKAAAAFFIGSGGAGTYDYFDNSHAWIGVGDTNTAATLADRNLKAAATSSNRKFKGMDAGFPQRTNNILTFQATFGTTEANFAWLEWGVANADLSGLAPGSNPTVPAVLMNRKVESLGTKTNTATWQIAATITVLIS